MNQSRAFIVSLFFAGLAMLLVFFYVNEEKSKVKSIYGDEVVVVVARHNINELEEIQASMLQTRVVPRAFAQPGTDSDPKTFEGAVAASPIQAGEQLLLTKVLLKGAVTGISTQVAIHRRALSIPVDDVTGVTKLLRPGDRVDIISTIQYQEGQGVASEVSTLLQNVHVLAVGAMVQNQVPAAFERDPITGNRQALNLRGSRAFNTITVEVSPQDAQRLIYVMDNGARLYMTLRNPVDRITASVPTITIDEVLGPNSLKMAREQARNAERNLATQAPAPPRPAPAPAPKPVAPAFQQPGVTIAD